MDICEEKGRRYTISNVIQHLFNIGLSPIYTAENFWHGLDESGTRTKKNSTDYSFTRSFFYRAKRCEIMIWYG